MSSPEHLALRIVFTTKSLRHFTTKIIYISFFLDTAMYCIDGLYKLLFNNVCGLRNLHLFIIL